MTMTTTDPRSLRQSEPSPVPKPSSTGRRAWLAFGVVLAVASVAWGTFSVIDLLAHTESVETSTYASADVIRLEVSSDNGSVTVVAGSGDSVSVRTEISEGIGATETTEQLSSGVLQLRGDCPAFGSIWCSVDYIIEMPAERAVEIDADNGAVVVRGLTGDVDVDNDNGVIELDDLGGNITVTNDNGGIFGTDLTSSVVRAANGNGSIALSFRAAPMSLTVTNSNGSIDVEVPDSDIAYRVDIRSNRGDTENQVRTDPASSRTIELSSENGSISVRSAR